jgi:crossover junction endodeoxyribonuclease RuvC
VTDDDFSPSASPRGSPRLSAPQLGSAHRPAALRSSAHLDASQRILGVDPGAKGALALLVAGMVETVDMPAVEIRGRYRVDAARVASIIRMWRPDHAFVEQVNAWPGQGVASCFSFGKSAGIVLGILAALQIPTSEVAAVTWKKKLGVPADKGAARWRASQLFPTNANDWSRVRDDGRAEAALIASFGQRALNGSS